MLSVFNHSLLITFFVFVMMLLVDFVNIVTKGRMSGLIQGGKMRQYGLASFLGSTPGCLGAFMNVTLYVHGMISLGAIVGGMIATSGDEAFVMLAQFPGTALLLFFLLFGAGIIFAWISDKIIKMLRMVPHKSCLQGDCDECRSEKTPKDTGEPEIAAFDFRNVWRNTVTPSFTRFLLLMLLGSFFALVVAGVIGGSQWTWKRVTFALLSICSMYISMAASEHYLHSHIWDHIIKKHLLRVFLWTFGALLIVTFGLDYWNLDAFVHNHMVWVLLMAALMGIIPESGPHLIFVMMYVQGLVPFSVLFTSSFVQDGHGMLPLLSYSLKDSALVKTFNFGFGLAVGTALFYLGL